ncbi:MAG: hypothetical protein NNA18_00275 [Nitrospira sp.]|nr:hypothetical protein [Nitrospira sp.]
MIGVETEAGKSVGEERGEATCNSYSKFRRRKQIVPSRLNASTLVNIWLQVVSGQHVNSSSSEMVPRSWTIAKILDAMCAEGMLIHVPPLFIATARVVAGSVKLYREKIIY